MIQASTTGKRRDVHPTKKCLLFSLYNVIIWARTHPPQTRFFLGTAPSMPALMIFLAALAMSVGWGFRGDYGHEAGAMVPGALLGLAISLTSRRPDWQSRGVTLAFLGAIGWAFGGQMSYDKLI